MSESAPAEPAAGVEKKRRLFRWVPTSLLVTLLGIALTAWLLPAFTRQRDDRQKALELKANAADDIATVTARMLRDCAQVMHSPNAKVRARRYTDGFGRWQQAVFRTDTRLNAYFGAAPAATWQSFYQLSRHLFSLCELAAADTGARATFFGDVWDRPTKRTFIETELENVFGAAAPELPKVSGLRYWREHKNEYALDLASGDPSTQEWPFENVTYYMLSRTKQVTAVVFAAHPVGLSTTRSDLMHDLVP
jgi:hypothetical protein